MSIPEVLAADGRPARLVRVPAPARELVGRSAAITRIQELVRRAAVANGGVLLVALPGADVESVARELHDRRHASAPFVAVNCAVDDPHRLDRQLFGEAGAVASDLEPVSPDSRIAAARGGTLFLRDIGELPAAAQTRLARIVRDGECHLDGVPADANIRVVASAVPGLDGDVLASRFRGDLYRRLVISRIDLPPLRDRAEDVAPLATRLIDDYCADRGIAPRTFSQAAFALLAALTWPGNLAELAHVVERVATDATRDVMQIEDLLPALRLDRAPTPFAPVGNLREARRRFERDYIAAVLQHHGWRIADAALTLGIQRPNLYRKARQLGIPVARVIE